MTSTDTQITEVGPTTARRRTPILVTGSCGLVGSAVVHTLLTRGYAVTATDLDTPANRTTAARLEALARERAGSLEVRWADLTDPDDVEALLSSVAPQSIIHLAAMIPPFCYARRDVARRINVDAVEHLVTSASALAAPPRLVLASSIAVYGPRNPHRDDGPLSTDTAVRPKDLYGGHKMAAETLVRESTLDWVVLRLGGVLSADQATGVDRNFVTFEAILPSDGKLQTVVVDDVATAFANAIITPYSRSVYLIGGDESHRRRQGDVAQSSAAALGLRGGFPPGRPGDPDDDDAWFATDWMDSTEAQRVLAFQSVSFPALLERMRAKIGPLRFLTPLAVPVTRAVLTLTSPYRGRPGDYAQPWDMAGRLWGDTSVDMAAPEVSAFSEGNSGHDEPVD